MIELKKGSLTVNELTLMRDMIDYGILSYNDCNSDCKNCPNRRVCHDFKSLSVYIDTIITKKQAKN